MRSFLRFFGAFILWAGVTGALAYAVHTNRHGIEMKFSSVGIVKENIVSSLVDANDRAQQTISRKFTSVSDVKDDVKDRIVSSIRSVKKSVSDSVGSIEKKSGDAIGSVKQSILATYTTAVESIESALVLF